MADTMATGADNSKEELMDTPIITHTQDISIKYIATTILQLVLYKFLDSKITILSY